MQKKGSKEKKYIQYKLRILLNANISRKIIPFLSPTFLIDFKHISDFTDKILTDSEIVLLAKKEKRVIITHDLDYGEIYYLKEQGSIGVIMLRLKDQTLENVIRKLKNFFQSQKINNIDISKSLIIISDKNIRVFSPQ